LFVAFRFRVLDSLNETEALLAVLAGLQYVSSDPMDFFLQ
jgi:hypothetical protein